jgi:hypothetical protein
MPVLGAVPEIPNLLLIPLEIHLMDVLGMRHGQVQPDLLPLDTMDWDW